MSDNKGKRRVVSKPSDAVETPKSWKHQLPRYSDIVRKSSAQSLNDLTGQTNFDIPEQQQDMSQPRVIRAGGQDLIGKKVIILPQQEEKPTFSITKTESQPQQQDIKGRTEQIKSLLNRYEQATKQQARRSALASGWSTSIALSNPQAAQMYRSQFSDWQDQPVKAIEGGQNAAKSRMSNMKSMQDIQQTDDDNDPNSPKANDARKILKQQFGMDIAPNASWRQINQVFPFIKVDTQRDTQLHGQDLIHSDKVMADETKKAQGQKNRVAAQQRTNTLAKAGISRAIITGTFGQQKSNMTSGAAQQKLADTNTAQDPFSAGGNGFYIMRPGMPPSANAKKEMETSAAQVAKYQNSLADAYAMILQAQGNPTFFNQNWYAIKSAMAQARQLNIKAMRNGVANGPDIEQAIQQIGDHTDAITWIRKGLTQQMHQQLQSIPKRYEAFANGLGYIKSDKPHPQTVSGGSGGTGTKAPINPAATGSANAAAEQYGLPAPFGAAGQPTQQPQPQQSQTPVSPAKQRLLQKIRGK